MIQKDPTLEMILKPIGVVRNTLTPRASKKDVTEQDLQERIAEIRAKQERLRNLVSELVIDPNLEPLLEGIEEFSHIVVLYWPHLLPAESRNVQKVHPMRRKDLPQRGIFATRSPARPNPVLISTVRLLKRANNILRVQALEAENGSPIVDIKPYVDIEPEAENPHFPDWLRQIRKDLEGAP